MAKLELSAPWYIRVRQLEELFKFDDEVHVVFDEQKHEVKLYVDDADKASALEVLLPQEYNFGDYNLFITVIPANDEAEFNVNILSKDYLYEMAFNCNPVFSFAKTVQLGTNTLTYVVFAKMVAQFFTDDLSDAYGNCSTLYQEIAKDIFGEAEGVSFCTDIEDVVLEKDTTTESVDINWP